MAFCFQIPEEEHEFYIKLIRVKNDAELNQNSLFAKVTVEASDYIRGLIEYTKDSRYEKSLKFKN